MYIYHLVDVITGQRLEQVYPVKAPSWTRRPEPVSWSADFSVFPAPVMSRGAPLETNPDAGLHTRIRPWRHALTVSWQQESGDEFLIAAGIVVSPLTTDETEGTVSVDTQCIREVLAGRMLVNKSHSRPTRSHVTVGPSSTLGVVSEILQRAMTPYSGQFWGDAFRLPLDLPVSRVTYEWAGAAHNSASIKKINGVEVARNLLPNPSFENGVTGWVGTNSQAFDPFFAWSNGAPSFVVSGTRVLSTVTTSSVGSFSFISNDAPGVRVTPGHWVAYRMGVGTANNPVAFWERPFFYINGKWEEPSFSNDPLVVTQSGQSLRSNTIIRAYKVPAGATHVRALLYPRNADGSSSPAPVGTTIRTDGWMIATALTREQALEQVAEYFDGSTANDSPVPGSWSFTYYGYNFKEALEAIEDVEDEARLVVDFNPYWDSNFRLRWAVEVFSEAERDNVLIDIGSTGSLQPQARYLGTSEDWAEVSTITHHTGKGSEADILYDRNSYVSDLVIAREQLITRPDIETQLHLQRQADADFEEAQRVFIQDEVAIALDPSNPEWWAPDQMVMGATVQLTIEDSAYYGHATIQRIMVGWKASGNDEIVLELQDLHATFDSVK